MPYKQVCVPDCMTGAFVGCLPDVTCKQVYYPPKPKLPVLTYRTPQQSSTTMDTAITQSKFQNISPLHF